MGENLITISLPETFFAHLHFLTLGSTQEGAGDIIIIIVIIWSMANDHRTLGCNSNSSFFSRCPKTLSHCRQWSSQYWTRRTAIIIPSISSIEIIITHSNTVAVYQNRGDSKCSVAKWRVWQAWLVKACQKWRLAKHSTLPFSCTEQQHNRAKQC